MHTKILRLIFALAALFVIYEIATAIYISQTTGTLQVNSSSAQATISISQAGHQIVNVGQGQARVRLSPGDYQVIASNDKTQVTKDVKIYKKLVTVQNLQLLAPRQTEPVSDANTLINLLPFTGPNSEYRVGYLYNFQGASARPIITITASTTKGQQDALAWVRSLGLDPSRLEIKYISANIK